MNVKKKLKYASFGLPPVLTEKRHNKTRSIHDFDILYQKLNKTAGVPQSS